MVEAAEQARAWFAENAPSWAPQQWLPLTFEECRGIYATLPLPGCMVGLYSLSLRKLKYDYLKHPSLQRYAEGCFK